MNPIRLVVSVFLCCVVGSLVATNYYVSTDGSLANPGTEALPFLTLQQAADAVSAGDSVYVVNGTYAGFDLRNTSGSAGELIVFYAMGDEVLINENGPIREDGINIELCNYIVVDGFQVNGMVNGGNGIRVVLSDFCEVRNCRCDQNDERGIFTGFTDDILIEYNTCTNSVDEHGIYVSNSSDRPIIRYNECYGNNNIGIHMNGDLSAGEDGIIYDAQVYGNVIHDNNLAAGINMDGCLNPVVYNNLIYNNHTAQGIALFQGDGARPTQGAKIYNNTIIVPDDGRWGILLLDSCNENTEIYNNIIINNHSWRGCVTVVSTDNFSCDYNILNDKMSASGDGSTITLSQWQALGFDSNSMLSNGEANLFVDISLGDYHLLEDALAVEAGTSIVNSVVTTDIEGLSRPKGSNYDIGAYEFADLISTAVDVVLRDQSITLFPNPTESIFEIEGLIGKYTIQILDANGAVQQTLSNDTSPIHVDLTSLASGTYFIQIRRLGTADLVMHKILKM